ncbi:AAA family ATPase [Burkholderia cenocepacia]|uniref:AAA family ATPase n=1 Tax=Burkholderia cenocepacia TaxID=95486 RepID=UPI00222FB87A|nr:ATP-binding protein [Burkholderia cenocepacia]MCW3640474.1 ATP-binding protein [Burkholderia cenocepacia]
MHCLKVQDFSCIKSAEISVARLTLLIGPQASGKSVLSKLIYFFIEIFDRQLRAVEEGNGLPEFKESIAAEFSRWFPSEAWGKNKFSITYTVGDFQIKFIRSTYGRKVSDTLRITMSKAFTSFYEDTAREYAALRQRNIAKNRADEYELQFKFREERRVILQAILGENEYISDQTFIPAGRAFFTSLGRVFAAFDGNNMLDPITTRFGRLYTSYRDPRFYYPRSHRNGPWEKSLYKLLGGVPKRKGESEVVELDDGRLVPFSALSSGQQELLPLITLLESSVNVFWDDAKAGSNLLYIEEPEAHLFPRSQSTIVELLVQLLRNDETRASLFLTTHSPYVLSKINALIKAGVLGTSSEEYFDKVNAITPENTWLLPGDVGAYAIMDGVVKNIIDGDGFVDSEYLDAISGEIESEYSALLAVEWQDD